MVLVSRARRRLLCLAAAASATGPFAALARAVVLTVRSPSGAEHDFDMPALERLPQRDIVTATPWYDRSRRFTGPLLRDVLAAAGARGAQLRAVALNDYEVNIPMSDARDYDVIVARLLDRQPLPRRDKGPLFIIYPFDEQAELRTQVYFTRCAWQLRRILVS